MILFYVWLSNNGEKTTCIFWHSFDNNKKYDSDDWLNYGLIIVSSSGCFLVHWWFFVMVLLLIHGIVIRSHLELLILSFIEFLILLFYKYWNSWYFHFMTSEIFDTFTQTVSSFRPGSNFLALNTIQRIVCSNELDRITNTQGWKKHWLRSLINRMI